MTALRPYQADLLDRIDAAFAGGSRRVLAQMPTGAGKSVCFKHLAANWPGRVLVLAHRRELIAQAARHCEGSSIYPSATPARVVVASVQTLARRLDYLPRFDLIVIDEAHHALPDTQYGKLLDSQRQAAVCGFTATPERLDGRGLGEVFDTLICGPSVAELQAGGYLSAALIYGPAAPVDLRGVRKIAGDFSTADLEQIMSKPSLVGDAVAEYENRAAGLATVSFEVSVAAAQQSAAAFRAEGWRAAAAWGGMPDHERARVFADLATGRLQVVTNCALIEEGFDVPAISCVILRRPTMSLGKHLQQVGRALRPSQGKPHAIVLDQVGNTLRHGLPSADRTWSLNAGKRGGEAVPKVKQCPECYAMHAPGPACPCCGHDYRPEQAAAERRRIEEREGALVLLTEADRRIKALRERPLAELLKLARTHDELSEIGKARGFHPGWVDIRSRYLSNKAKGLEGV